MSKYNPHTQTRIKEVLKTLGYKSVADMYKGISENILYPELQTSDGVTEIVCESKINNLSNRNRVYDNCYMGAGVYNHYIPQSVIDVYNDKVISSLTHCDLVKSNSLMQAVFDVQKSLASFMKMPATKVSYQDKNFALICSCIALVSSERNKLLVSSLVKPQTKSVLKVILPLFGIEVEEVDSLGLPNTNADFIEKSINEKVFAVYVEQPNYFGTIEELEEIANITKLHDIKFIVGAYPTAFGAVKAPGECGADLVVGDLQPFGLNIAFGGDSLGFVCADEKTLLAINGSYISITENNELVLQNNDNTLYNNQIPVRAVITCGAYLNYLGKDGLKQVALKCATNAHYLNFALAKAGIGVKYKNEFFNEFITLSKCTAENILNALSQQGILGGYKIGTHEILWCATELNSREEMDRCASICGEVNK